MATTYLTRVFGTPTNGKKFTFSAWMKRSLFTGDQAFFSTGNSSDPITTFRWNSDGKIYLFYLSGGSMVWEFATNSFYRDGNGWYNVVIAFDSTESSAGDRLKLWVNGEQITTWSTEVNVSLDMTPTMNTAVRHDLGTNGSGGNYFTGLMSHVHFVDGTAYPASTFGSTDATTGEWKINTNPTVTYGDNGFFLLKNDASLTDQSGEGNNFTLGGGTITKTEDNPSDNFATLNPLANTSQTLSHGNTSGYGAVNKTYTATLGFQSGKYYWEAKCVTQNTYTMIVGITNETNLSNGAWTSSNVGSNANGWSYFLQSNADNGKSFTNNVLGSVYQTVSQGDILQIAVDADAGKIWWGVNGTWVNSGNPATGANAVYTNVSTDQILFPAYSAYDGVGGNPLISFNFGNGYFGTSAISSAGTNASNIGIFEYDVPTGYTALSTKGLNL